MTSYVVPLPALECRLWRNRLVLSREQNFARMAWRWYHGPPVNVLHGNVTVVDTLAQSNLNHSIHVAGSAAEAAAEFKNRKYSALSRYHQFVPFALETLGPICRAASDLITELSKRTSERSWESREGDFLFQRFSIAVQRGNAAALHGTFGEFTVWAALMDGCPEFYCFVTFNV